MNCLIAKTSATKDSDSDESPRAFTRMRKIGRYFFAAKHNPYLNWPSEKISQERLLGRETKQPRTGNASRTHDTNSKHIKKLIGHFKEDSTILPWTDIRIFENIQLLVRQKNKPEHSA
jgi:hypothetical protein